MWEARPCNSNLYGRTSRKPETVLSRSKIYLRLVKILQNTAMKIVMKDIFLKLHYLHNNLPFYLKELN